MSHPCRPETHRLSERIEAAAIVRVDTVVFDLVDDLLADDWRGVIGGSTSNLVAGSDEFPLSPAPRLQGLTEAVIGASAVNADHEACDGAVFASFGGSHVSSSLMSICHSREGV